MLQVCFLVVDDLEQTLNIIVMVPNFIYNAKLVLMRRAVIFGWLISSQMQSSILLNLYIPQCDWYI